MSNAPAEEHLDHALSEEFAGQAERIHVLKQSDAHFRKLLDQNHALWKEIQQIQKNIHPASDEALETLEKTRLLVLDEIAARLRKPD